MFILRQIFKDGMTSNEDIGHRYLVTDKRYHPEQFKTLLGNTVTHPDQEKVFAILSYHRGEKMNTYPLYTGFTYYIMSESGKTFDNLTYRP